MLKIASLHTVSLSLPFHSAAAFMPFYLEGCMSKWNYWFKHRCRISVGKLYYPAARQAIA